MNERSGKKCDQPTKKNTEVQRKNTGFQNREKDTEESDPKELEG